jgi:Repeat of unknown function (DUF5648)
MPTHFYTTNPNERQNAIQNGFHDEGIACFVWTAPAHGPAPLFRADKSGGQIPEPPGDHLYTMSLTEHENAMNNLGYYGEGITGYIYPEASAGAVPFFRAFSPAGGHFYTTNSAELQAAVAGGFVDEGVTGFILTHTAGGAIPLFRLYRVTHLYTTDPNERERALQQGYSDEGIAGFVFPTPPTGPAALFRAYCPSTGCHLYTMDMDQYDSAVGSGQYVSEGIACYILPWSQVAFNGYAGPAIALWRADLYLDLSQNPNGPAGDFFYTTNPAEYHNAVFNLGYGAVGVAGAVLPHAFRDGGVPFYRLFGPV